MRLGSSLLTVVVAATVAAGSLTGAAAARVEGAADATLKVTLKEWKVIPSTRTCVAAGRITFAVRNAGALEHELVVLRTNRPPGRLPMKGSQAVETGLRGKTPELVPGRTLRLTLRLRSGRYALLCNLPGHYKAGQFAGLCVR